MKIINKPIRLSLTLFLAVAMIFMGCEDNSDFRKVRNEALTNLQRGGMIQFEDVRARLLSQGDDPNTGRLSVDIIDPNRNATEYHVSVVTPSDTSRIGAVSTSFPSVLEIDFSEVANAFGTDLEIAEAYRFLGEVTTEDGTVWNAKELNITTDDDGVTTVEGNTRFEVFQPANTGLKQAMLFDVVTVCSTPPATADFLGDWEVVSRTGSSRVLRSVRNYIESNVVSIIAGSGENEVVFQDFWGDGLDFAATFDPELDGDLSSEQQESYFDPGRNTMISSQLEPSRDKNAPRAYICDDLIVLRFFHTREDTNGGALSSIRTVVKLRKQ